MKTALFGEQWKVDAPLPDENFFIDGVDLTLVVDQDLDIWRVRAIMESWLEVLQPGEAFWVYEWARWPARFCRVLYQFQQEHLGSMPSQFTLRLVVGPSFRTSSGLETLIECEAS